MSTYSDGDDCSSVWDVTFPKARFEYRCAACGRAIALGEVYERTGSLYDGSWTTLKRCGPCVVIYEHLCERLSKETKEKTEELRRIRDKFGRDSREFLDAYYEQPDGNEIAWRLDCRHDYEERWGEPPPPHITDLAFWLPGDPLPTVAS